MNDMVLPVVVRNQPVLMQVPLISGAGQRRGCAGRAHREKDCRVTQIVLKMTRYLLVSCLDSFLHRGRRTIQLLNY